MKLRIDIVISLLLSIITLLSFWAFSYLFAEVTIFYLGVPFALFTFLFFYVLLQRNGKEWLFKIENVQDPLILLSALTVFSVFTVLFVPAYDGSILQWVDIPLTNWLRCGASLLLSSFLPGYFLLKVLDNKSFIRGCAVIVTSFLLSLFITFITTFLILIAKGSIPSISPQATIAINLLFLSIYLYTKKKRRKTCFYDLRISAMTILLVSIFVIVMVGSFIVMYYNFPVTPGDMWDHLALSTLYSQGFPVAGGVLLSSYPYFFHLYLANYFSMAGIPSAIALQSLYVLSFMPVLAFYSAVNEWFNEKKDKGIAVVATSLSILLGFGSLYALYLKLSGSSFAISGLLQVTSYKTYDIYFRFGYLPDVVAPLWEIGIPVFLMLLYVLKKNNGETVIALLIALFVATGYLGHVAEIPVFALVFLVYCSFFQHKFSWRINTSVLFGLFIVTMIDILAPSQAYITTMNAGVKQFSLPYLSVVILSSMAVVIPFVKRKIHISFTKIKQQILLNLPMIWKYAIWLLLYAYIFSVIVWLTFLDSFEGQVGFTPFYILPIRLGPVLLLSLCIIFVSLPKVMQDKRIVFFTVLVVIGFAMEQISNYSIVPYESDRFATFTFIGLCVIAAYGLKKIFAAFSNSSLMKKVLVCIMLFLVIIPGMLGTSLYYIYASYYSGRGTAIVSADLSSLNYVKQNLSLNASVITLTAESASDLETFAGLSPLRIMNYLPILNAGPSLLLYVIGNSNVKYIYINQRDEAPLENTPFLYSLLNYLPISYRDNDTTIYAIPSLSPPVAGSKTLVIDNQYAQPEKVIDVSSFEYYTRGAGVIEDYGASVGNDGLVLHLTANNNWVSYTLLGLNINTTIASGLSFNFKTSENAFFTMILHFKDGTTQWIYRLKSPEFTTATYNLAEGKVITGIEVLDELTQQNISSGSIYLNSIDFYKSSKVIASTMFSILQLDHNIIQLPSSQLLGQFYGRALENVSTVILTSDPPQDLGKALDWVQKGGNLMIMGGLTNGYFSNLLGIKPVPVAQLNVSSFEYYTRGAGVIEDYGASVGNDGLVLHLTANNNWVSYTLLGLNINTTIASGLSFNFKTSENAFFTMILHFKDGTTQWIYRLKSPEFTTATYNLAEGKVITGIEVLDELTQQNVSSVIVQLKSIEFSKSPIAVNTVSAENGDAIKIPSIIVPQINAENANSPLYFTNLDTKQSTPFGFYKKIGNGTIYFVITDPILSTIENLSNSNIHLLESMLNLTMNTFNLQIPSHVSSMGTFPGYNTVNGNIILNGNATIVSNYIDSTEQIPTGTVKITSENINAEFRNSTIESLSAYGEATLLVNGSSELSTISGSPSPSTIILTSNESAECAIILSNKTNVELNIEDSYGENHSITVEDGTVYFNSNKLSLLLENPTVEVTGETLFKSLAVHIAPYTLLAGALNNVNIEGSCAFKMDYVGGGSALISNFVYDGTAKKLVYPSSSQQELEIPWIAIFFSPLNALTIMCLAILFAVNEMRRSGTMSRLRMKRQVKCGRK